MAQYNFFSVIALATTINMINVHHVMCMKKSTTKNKENTQSNTQTNSTQSIDNMLERINSIHEISNNCVHRINESMGLAHSANGTSIRAYETSTQALERANEVLTSINQFREELTELQTKEHNTNNQIQEFNTTIDQIIEEATQQIRSKIIEEQQSHDLENKIQLMQAKIRTKQQLGIFEQKERLHTQASIDAATIKWETIKTMLHNPAFMAKIIFALTIFTLGFYIIKQGIPKLIDHLTQPSVITETSIQGWLKQQESKVHFDDLIFNPCVQEQLSQLVQRIQSAKEHQEPFPNILLHGPPGTGKTAFAKALAYHSGLNYALTSGSEFAKITDLNIANNELRKLLNWANNNDNSLIIFIDEAESLFANRNLPTTSKAAQDLINTFLALTEDTSHKKVMFIFSTNNPCKLDDAIINRIGVHIPFALPGTSERITILTHYLKKFAQENSNTPVNIPPAILQQLSSYTDSLENISPRTLKFAAQEMIIASRLHKEKQLTHAIIESVINTVKQSLEQTQQWKLERNAWVAQQIAVFTHRTIQKLTKNESY